MDSQGGQMWCVILYYKLYQLYGQSKGTHLICHPLLNNTCINCNDSQWESRWYIMTKKNMSTNKHAFIYNTHMSLTIVTVSALYWSIYGM